MWLLLFAPTLQRNAQASPVGTRRTVSLAVLRPIAALSRDLLVSHVVSVADGIVGKGGGTGVRSAISTLGPHDGAHRPAGRGGPPPAGRGTGDGPGPPSGPATTAPTAAYQHPTPSDPLRVLILGDSLGTDLGHPLQADLADTNVVLATLDAQVDTGLTRPDYYNWPAELQADLPKAQPQVVVVMMGANDPQDFPGPPDVPYGTAQWDQLYAQRVESFMEEATSSGAKVIWVGQPHMQTPTLNAKMTHLDAIFQAEAAKNPGVTYFSSAAVLSNAQGQFTSYLTVAGTQEQVRPPDGIHLAPTGADLLAQAVITAMRTRLHIAIPPTG
jgi:hypothetical protein